MCAESCAWFPELRSEVVGARGNECAMSDNSGC